jgi:hypothetical protein
LAGIISEREILHVLFDNKRIKTDILLIFATPEFHQKLDTSVKNFCGTANTQSFHHRQTRVIPDIIKVGGGRSNGKIGLDSVI